MRCLLILILLLPELIFSQQFYEAFGISPVVAIKTGQAIAKKEIVKIPAISKPQIKAIVNHHKLRISFDKRLDNATITIFTIAGKCITSLNSSGLSSIDVGHNLPYGVYLIRIADNRKTIQSSIIRIVR